MKDGTILIVDDEKMIRDLLIAMLQESGQYRTLEAENGRDALAICKSEDVDLVFTDLKMPVMGGMELLAEMRRQKPETPIVILTGFGRREDVIEALRLGASNFLLKPQEVELVATVAGKILRMRHRKKLEQQIFDFFNEEYQTYCIPTDLQYTLPLIDLLSEKITRVSICDEPELTNIRIALDEALVNAIVHGNLEIPSRAKGSSLDEMMAFNQMVRERSQLSPFRDRKIQVTRHLTPDFVAFTIEDEGNGFDWRSLPDSLDHIKMLANHGRGLFLIRAFMSHVDFNEKGNRITMVKIRPGASLDGEPWKNR
ncbi:MAG TPA: response regulator [bacterium]|nr:response regulator [Candidatus Omnitrophota bacterium]HOJ61882.1 response regulator [bacterium]HOL95152.1 response regulator [bacterium]HPO99850.1 response regulator [bacterium]HXK92359.1 response regulator [bacterium]